MSMPVMEPDLDATVLRRWAQTIDEGPFSSLCWGERIAFDNPESLTLLGALAAWTHRVPLITTVVVPQLHDPVLLAKSLAPVIEAAIQNAGAPLALVGVIIAAVVLLPEGLAALRAARVNRLQTSLNLALGSALVCAWAQARA
jgi:hypothetical protein